jgi:hypothetical protein
MEWQKRWKKMPIETIKRVQQCGAAREFKNFLDTSVAETLQNSFSEARKQTSKIHVQCFGSKTLISMPGVVWGTQFTGLTFFRIWDVACKVAPAGVGGPWYRRSESVGFNECCFWVVIGSFAEG